MKNYDDVIKHLNMALVSCKNTNETESLRVLIKQIIFSFEKLIKKRKKTLSNTKSENKLYFPNPQLSLDVIDNWIKEQKNAINDN